MKSKQPEITHENEKIYLRFTSSEFDKVGITNYTDELWQMIITRNWHINKKYIFSGNKSLHRIVMEYWYGEVYCKKKIKSGSVIDHIDNDGFNCTNENLEFLDKIKNWSYKGQYYDRIRRKNTPIAAVNIYKNRSKDRFQITIGFNRPFCNSHRQVISKAFLMYNTNDYDLVLADAVQLVESVEKGKIDISLLRCNYYQYECQTFIASYLPLKPGNVIKVESEWFMILGEGVRIEKIAPNNDL